MHIFCCYCCVSQGGCGGAAMSDYVTPCNVTRVRFSFIQTQLAPSCVSFSDYQPLHDDNIVAVFLLITLSGFILR